MTGIIEKICSDDTKHIDDIICIAYHNGYAYTGGADGKIKIWDEDLNLRKMLGNHDCYIYALAINENGKLYSSACDGIVKITENPLDTDNSRDLMKSEYDIIQCIYCYGNKMYTGDDKGVVTMWENDRILFKFNLVEEVKSLFVQELIYTVRDLDVIITEVMKGNSGKYSTRKTIEGKSPLYLCGPLVNGKHSYLVFATRSGMGLTCVDNLPGRQFPKMWTKDDCHEMIINSICGNDKLVFSGGYDGFVKCWTDIDKGAKLLSDINIGNCINCMCISESSKIFSGSSDGIVRRLHFTSI